MAKHSAIYSIYTECSYQLYEVCLIISILWTKKLKFNGIKYFVQGYTAHKIQVRIKKTKTNKNQKAEKGVYLIK